MSKIKYYPVGNGDQSLITLKDETTILVDCNIRKTAEDDKSKINIKDDLLASIKKRNDNFFVDVFILTHGDEDHCRGFEANFYQGDPKKYSEKNREANEIIVEEMWFSPMIAEEHKNDDEEVYQKEAERRIDLHRRNHSDKDLPGNRIRIIGYDKDKDYKDLDYLRTTPGNPINIFNHKVQAIFSVFIHAPFKEQLQSKDKNQSSIVFQARFKENSSDNNYACLAMFGGDSDHNSWKLIMEESLQHGNENALYWDLFLAPHHCSWSFFNDRPYKDKEKGIDNSTPALTSLKILDYKLDGAKIIASSEIILDNDNNPPHYPAKQEYVDKVIEGNFINTEKFYEDYYLPVIFIIDKDGPTLKKNDVKVNVSSGFSNPSRAGRI